MRHITTLLLFLFFISDTFAQQIPSSDKELEKNFQIPPQHARPQTWWHWMNGNVTEEGIKADLKALKDIGMGGVQILEIGASIPQGPVGTQDKRQMKMYKTAFETADELDMELVMHNCPGWSSSGGPWVEPKHSMKQIVWTEKVVAGNGEKQSILLPRPFTKLGFYRDTYVLAFPTLKGEEVAAEQLASIWLNGKHLERQKIADGDWTTIQQIKGEKGNKPVVQFNFSSPYTISALTVVPAIVPAIRKMAVSGILQASDNGKDFKDISTFRCGNSFSLEAQACISFNAVRAKYFRLVFNQEAIIRDIELTAAARIHNYPEKAGYANISNPPLDLKRSVSLESVIMPEQIVDLHAMMLPDGTLEWEVPEGNWTIMRFGYTATGQGNIVPTTSGDGLEIDKLSKRAVDIHFDAFFGTIEKNLGSVLGKKLNRTFIDSYEVGMQNWTDNLPAEFIARKGYDILKYMPVLAGRIVKDIQTSEKFLWDFRRNLSDMFADNYVGHFHKRCQEKGMLLSIEPYGDGPFDDFQAGSRADIPMGEFWSRLMYDMRRTKLPAMIAHTYGMRVDGNQIVEAESFTGAPDYTSWKNSPYSMKAQGDLVFCKGLTRYVFHTYAHEPHPSAAPGMTMGRWGFHFKRNNGWFDKAEPWITYISRCQYLLQKGNFVADLCYFAGENSKVQTLGEKQLNPSPPKGYDYDLVNTEVFLNRMTVEDGRIVLPDGVSYRLLIFPDDSKLMSVAVLKQIKKLLNKGAYMLCNRPILSPSLADELILSKEEYQNLVNEIWGDINGKTIKENACGKGKIYSEKTIEEIFEELDYDPDFRFVSEKPDATINYIHRKLHDSDFYFVANRLRRPEQIIAEFKVSGKQPEFWNPETGEIVEAPLFVQENGRTKVAIDFDEAGSIFVVFRKPAKEIHLTKLPELNFVEPPDFKDVTNNFTLSAWIKPETNIKIVKEAIEGSNNDFAKGAVVAPPAGDELYGNNHRAAGFVAGINGICVFEKDTKSYPAVLVYEKPIEGWTHVAVVYDNGTPKLYVDGVFAKEGLKSGKTIHPGIGYQHKKYDMAYFEGDDAGITLTDEVLTGNRLQSIVKEGLPDIEKPRLISISKQGSDFKAEIFENGSYPNPFEDEEIKVLDIPASIELNGTWKVTFQSVAKEPADMEMKKLISWIDSDNKDLRHFSGTGTYSQTFDLNKSMFKEDQRIYLDLGRVEVMAEVKINGKNMGILWKPPYRLDITDFVKPAKNTIEIAVTNLWPNRLIGDAVKATDLVYGPDGNIKELPQWYRDGKDMPQGERSTFTTWKHFNGNEALLESGLMGSVKILTSKIIEIKTR
jgi:hypothetical protein